MFYMPMAFYVVNSPTKNILAQSLRFSHKLFSSKQFAEGLIGIIPEYRTTSIENLSNRTKSVMNPLSSQKEILKHHLLRSLNSFISQTSPIVIITVQATNINQWQFFILLSCQPQIKDKLQKAKASIYCFLKLILIHQTFKNICSF